MSLFDSLREEANKRKQEKQESDSFIAREKERIKLERQKAREHRNIIRKKIKFVDDIASKSEEKKDQEELAKIELQESERVKRARSERRNRAVSRNKGKLAIGGLVCLALIFGSVFTVNQVQKHKELEKYTSAVDCILDENYEQAEAILTEISTEDSDELLAYSKIQQGIDSYSGDPDEFQTKLEDVDEIDNPDVKAQIKEAEAQVEAAGEVQSSIDRINTAEVTLESKEDVSEIAEQVSGLDERYEVLVDTKALKSAETTIEHLEKKDDVGKTILAINEIGDVSLDSETTITKARSAYDDLELNEQKDVANLSILRSAESSLSNLKREKEAAEKAEQERARKEAEEKAQQEAEAAEERKEEEIKLGYTVWVTKSGKCYHIDGCSSLRSKAASMTQKQAIDRGYSPCNNCIYGSMLPDYWFNH